MNESTTFDIKIDRILNILCDQIYDSPLSLLRENVQNAYDAILMRRQTDPFCQGRISITIEGNMLTIEDNGEGMDKKGLKENYWTAGKSGKNNEIARKAGVVGTFGIGAMANFGVCTELKVVTRRINQTDTLTSWVRKEDLSVSEECIGISDNMERLEDYGTKIIVSLDSNHLISSQDAENYLRPYVEYLQIPVSINGKIISMEDYHLPAITCDNEYVKNGNCSGNGIIFQFEVRFNKGTNLQPRIFIHDIDLYGKKLKGDVVLTSTSEKLMGLHNEFGLAPVPISTYYSLGGVANLDILSPTAGRDSLSRESVDILSRIGWMTDEAISKIVSETEYADNCRELMSYINSTGRYDLANHITIGTVKENERIELGRIDITYEGKKVLYYNGSDASIKSSYSESGNLLLIPSSDYLRNKIQLTVLRAKGIEQVADLPMVFDVIEADTVLSLAEFSIKFKIKTVVEYDYLIPSCDVKYARISHGLSTAIEYKNDQLIIYLNRGSQELTYLSDLYSNNYDMFEPFVKDLVRTRLYPKFSSYVPSSQRDGADALYAILQRKKELYTIESSEQGRMEYVIDEYMNGRASMKDVLSAIVTARKSQTQTVNHVNVGNVEEVVGTYPKQSAGIPTEPNANYNVMPPIMRMGQKSKYKILRTDNGVDFFGYHTFLALSDKMFKDFYDFFLQPHSTRVIWSMHKIIYVFTHASGNLTLYYDMDLEKKLPGNSTGGCSIMSSTIITDNRIFVPVINEMDEYFNIQEGQLKFYVRYDSVKS